MAKDCWTSGAPPTKPASCVYDFTDPELSTRFLGDLYQDLSEYAKKTFALLQTPEFVEEFILDQTLEPGAGRAAARGLQADRPDLRVRALPARRVRTGCSTAGHTQAPDLEPRARVQKALDAVHGVDLNPFAVAIARFRLTVAALQACGRALAGGRARLHASTSPPATRCCTAATS